MKKALIITTISGFLPQFEMNDVRILKSYGYEIHYASNFNNPVYTFEEKDLQNEGIILHHIDIAKSPLAVGRNVKAYHQLKKIIKNEKINLIHCHNPMGAVVGRLAGSTGKIKPYIIYTAHGFHFYKGAPSVNWLLYYTMEKLLARKTDMIITINREDFNAASRFKLKKKGVVHQIHGVGVDVHRFHSDREDGLQIRKMLGIPEQAFHIVTAAELNQNKNQKVIIEAIARNVHKDIYYSICGKGPNEAALLEQIRELGLENRVHLLGFRTDMDRILHSADCFAFPSLREGLGIAAIEALSSGVPLIVADNRGSREYMEQGKNGYICQAENVEQFTEAITNLYEDKKLHARMSSYCRHIALLFSKEKNDQMMRSIYKEADERVEKQYAGK